MKVDKKIMHFRKQRARELELVSKSIERNIESGVTGPIFRAISQLNDPNYIFQLKNGNTDSNTWGYEIDGFTLGIPNSKHLRPKGVNSLNLILSIRVVANCSDWENLGDPLKELNFRVVIKGIGDRDYYFGFHIDRHESHTETEEVHPIYHLQYLVNPNQDKAFEYGSVLYMDTPRIMHYPMEFILGIGYLTANFFPEAYQTLLDDGLYYNLLKEYQDRIWKPYSHTLAHYWQPFNNADILWNPKLLCPYLLE